MPVTCPASGDLDPIETASRDEIAALQLARLRATLQRVHDHVPHYRRAFDARGVHPSDLMHLADLAKFPFTTKADLRDNYPFGLFAVPRNEVVRIHASSGTTGKPTVAAGFGIDFIVPGRAGDVLTARCTEVAKAGRSGVYDVEVTNQRGERIAVFRGRSHTLRRAPP